MPVKDMISCKLAHVYAIPQSTATHHKSLTDLTDPHFYHAAAAV